MQSIQWLEHWNTEESVFDSRHGHKFFSSQSLRHHMSHVASSSIYRKKGDGNMNLTSHMHLECWLKCSEFHLHSRIRIIGVAFGQVRDEYRVETRDYKWINIRKGCGRKRTVRNFDVVTCFFRFRFFCNVAPCRAVNLCHYFEEITLLRKAGTIYLSAGCNISWRLNVSPYHRKYVELRIHVHFLGGT